MEGDRAALGRGGLSCSLAARGGLRSTLARLLAHVLKADIETAYGRDLVDHALAAAWQTLTLETGLLVSEAGGLHKLPLSALAFMPMSKAWVCPVTRRLLDVALRRITPCLPQKPTDATARFEAVAMPLYDRPFGGGIDALAQVARARDWLVTWRPRPSSRWNRPGSAPRGIGWTCRTRTLAGFAAPPAATCSTSPTGCTARATRSA